MSAQRDYKHGVDCVKMPHMSGGYHHSIFDDGPYSVDGVEYCGRCHCWMSMACPLPLAPKATDMLSFVSQVLTAPVTSTEAKEAL